MQITLPKPPKIKEQREDHAVFEIDELYPGFGVTLGNALRRVLYSSLPGAAVTRLKIKGAPHGFSTIPGILEDVLEIILNLKQVRFKMHGEESQTATIKAKGIQRVTAKNIELPSQVEVINKDVHIATLTSRDANLEAEFVIEAGLGYIAAEQQKKERVDIGTIPVDAIFTPMRRVNFEVENMRVGDRTDYNRLIVEVVTDGTVSPQEAFEYASKLLVQHFQIAGEFKKKKEKVTKSKPKTKAKPSQTRPRLKAKPKIVKKATKKK